MLFFFFFNDTATTEIYTLSLHDALPISRHSAFPHHALGAHLRWAPRPARPLGARRAPPREAADRKSTRLNSSHSQKSYAVLCLKKKKKMPAVPTHTVTRVISAHLRLHAA